MKITYVLMQFPLSTQTFAMSDVAALRSLGHEVRIECLLPANRKQRELCETYQLDRNEIHNATLGSYLIGLPLAVKYLIENRALFGSLLGELTRQPKRLLILLALLPRIAALVSSIARRPPDVVHAFWGHWPSLVPALVGRYASNVRTSVHMGAYDLYAGFPLRVTAGLVDQRFTHSISNLPRISEMGVSGPVHMIHRGIPLGDLTAADAEGRAISTVPLQFCTASALVKDKKVDAALRVFALIKQEFPAARFVIAGDGPERRHLEALASELGIASAVVFVGYVKRDELFRIMCASEFFLFLSGKVSERLPNVVKEAMLARCVCFVSATQGIEELVQGPDYGFVLKDGNPGEVAREILGPMRDSESFDLIAERAHSLVVNNFTSESAMRRYVGIWTVPVQRQTN